MKVIDVSEAMIYTVEDKDAEKLVKVRVSVGTLNRPFCVACGSYTCLHAKEVVEYRK